MALGLRVPLVAKSVSHWEECEATQFRGAFPLLETVYKMVAGEKGPPKVPETPILEPVTIRTPEPDTVRLTGRVVLPIPLIVVFVNEIVSVCTPVPKVFAPELKEQETAVLAPPARVPDEGVSVSQD